MEFIFTCPQTNGTFHSANFKITQNQGVQLDAAGHKTLDAKVVLIDPCPFCGGIHTYHASELACPFSA
jgi:hypothetical protein